MIEKAPCPSCGALPCDWVDDPHKTRDWLIWVISEIRLATGVGMKPMLDELPAAIFARMNAAPELLAQLEWAESVLKCFIEGSAQLESLRATIAKAKGLNHAK